MNKYDMEEIERIKQSTEAVDGLPLMKMALEMRDKPEEEQEEFSKIVEEGFRTGGDKFLMRAFIEEDMTEQEYLNWKEKGVDSTTFCPILQAFYMQKDKPQPDLPIVVTTPRSPSYKNREELTKRFGVRIVSAPEALEIMKTEDPEKFAEFEKVYNNGY